MFPEIMKRVQILALLCVSSCAAQTFKGNTIGMTLEEFKQANKGQKVYINTGDPTRRRNKKLDQTVDTPMCTDTLDGFPGTENTSSRRPGEIICNISPGSINPAARMITDMEMRSILYHFYAGKLYEISLTFRTVQFLGMKSAFTAKFGPPSLTTNVDCQNGFGARWTSEDVNWNIAPSAIATLVEGCANGPAQNSYEGYASGSINNSALEPPPSEKKAVDF